VCREGCCRARGKVEGARDVFGWLLVAQRGSIEMVRRGRTKVEAPSVLDLRAGAIGSFFSPRVQFADDDCLVGLFGHPAATPRPNKREPHRQLHAYHRAPRTDAAERDVAAARTVAEEALVAWCRLGAQRAEGGTWQKRRTGQTGRQMQDAGVERGVLLVARRGRGKLAWIGQRRRRRSCWFAGWRVEVVHRVSKVKLGCAECSMAVENKSARQTSTCWARGAAAVQCSTNLGRLPCRGHVQRRRMEERRDGSNAAGVSRPVE
jgi:hypothetical protein